MIRKGRNLMLALALAGAVGGCFQPLYGDRSVVGGSPVTPALKSVQVSPINTPNGTRLSRVGVEVRDDLIFRLTGGTGEARPTHVLNIQLSSTNLQVIVDIDTARPDVQNYGINASYTLVETATGRTAVTGQTFSRVSYNIPGQQQRFGGERALRDAENRAARVIAEQIQIRLASFFAAGT